MSNRYRSTYAEVNLPNLLSNYKSIENIVKNKKVIPVVKANAYGHGAIEVVKYLTANGVDHFAVSLLEEALELRENFEDITILVMGVVENNGLLIAAENNITVTISNLDQVHYLEKIQSTPKKLKVHVKIDTGMNRLGLKSNENILYAINLLKKPYIDLEGIYTHFSTADVDKTYYDIQMNRFKEVLSILDYDFKMIHVSNSSSSIKYEKEIDFTTHVRLGISLYGLSLEPDVNFLKNTFSLHTKISEIKRLCPGDKVGYGATYTASSNELIGVLPVGYADGFIRKNKGGDVEICGKRFKVVGNICMDQMFVKINENIMKTDDVILFGGLISIDEVADRLDTINYEIICQVTYRVPKVYIK